MIELNNNFKEYVSICINFPNSVSINILRGLSRFFTVKQGETKTRYPFISANPRSVDGVAGGF